MVIVLADAPRLIEVPWAATLTTGEHRLVLYVLVVAVLALTAGFLRSWATRHEVGPRYRTAVTARLGMLAVALVTSVLIAAAFLVSYQPSGAGWRPTPQAVDVFAARYIGWTVSVPLLTVELLAVCAVVGIRARRTRGIALVASAAMIFCGFLGSVVIDEGRNPVSFLLWAGISAVFWLLTTGVLIRAVRASRGTLTPEAQTLLNRATLVLLAGWVIYPVVYLLPLLVGGGAALTVTIVITLTAADVVIKLFFSGQIHRVAKLRTAEDVRAGVDVHPESIWISSVKQSDAGRPREVYLADGADVHDRRRMPPGNTATPSAAPDPADEIRL